MFYVLPVLALLIWDGLCISLIRLIPPAPAASWLYPWAIPPLIVGWLVLLYFGVRGGLRELARLRSPTEFHIGAKSSSGAIDVTEAAATLRHGTTVGPMLMNIGRLLLALAVFEVTALLPILPWSGSAGPWWLTLILAAAAAITGGLCYIVGDDGENRRSSGLRPVWPYGDSVEGRTWMWLIWGGARTLVRLSFIQLTLFVLLGGWWHSPERVANTLLISAALTLPVVAADPLMRWSARKASVVGDTLVSVYNDGTRYVLYLRSFDEDALKCRIDSGRAYLIHQLSPVLQHRFEELLASNFSEETTMVAVAPPNQERVQLGANRVAFSNADWKARVEELFHKAEAVIVSATPDSVQPGLMWELNHIAEAELTHCALVLAPWPAEQRLQRWREFCTVVSGMSYFRGIEAVEARDRTLLVYRRRGGWHAIEADQNDESAYATAMSTWFRTVTTTRWVDGRIIE